MSTSQGNNSRIHGRPADLGQPRGRGRPQRALSLAQPSVTAASLPTLTAWLLRTNRQLATDTSFHRVSTFAAAFPGGSWSQPADKGKISRWETTGAAVSYRTVRRYEELLALPEHSLVAVINTLHRYFGTTISRQSALHRPSVPADDLAMIDRLGQTLDKIRYPAPITGSEWDDLTGFLSSSPWNTPLPLATWDSLAERLLAEMIIADGLPWLLRFESFNRLLAHPVGQVAAIGACASLGADRSNQVFIETLCALDGSVHPDAGRQVMRQLVTPTNDRAFAGALLACVRKSRYHHFTDEETGQLAAIVRDLLTGHDEDDPLHQLAGQILGNLRDHPASRPLVDDPALLRFARTEQTERIAGPAASRTIVGRMQAHVQTADTVERDQPDEVLPALLAEMLFHPVSDVRLYLSMLMRASPYRSAVADSLVAELRRPHGGSDVPASMVAALRVVGDAPQAPLVRRLVLLPDVPDPVREAAAFSVGHMDPVVAGEFWDQAIAHNSRRWSERHDEASASILTGLVYSLGVAGDTVLLRRMRHTDIPAPARTSARWWLDLPTAVRTSARR